MWLYGGFAPHAPVSHVRVDAADGALLQLRGNGTAAGAMRLRLTSRCREILRFMPTARCLSTTQAHRRFFRGASMSAVRRRLRLLAKAGYLRKHQQDRMR